MRYSRLSAAGMMVVAALAGGPVAARTQGTVAGPAYRWTGTVTMTSEFKPAVDFQATDWTGSLRDTRTVRVVARELQSADVHDGSGRLVGRVTWLQDDGSTWTGEVSDTERHLDAIQFIAGQARSGPINLFGVIYRSLVTPNPIEVDLADGAYCLQVLPGPLDYTLRITEPGRPEQVSREASTNGMFAGDCSLPRKLATVTRPMLSDDVALAARGPAQPGELSEGRARTLVNGVMRGDSRRVDGGSTFTAQWDLQHRLQIDATITPADAAWRPKFQATTTLTASIPESLGTIGKFRFTLFDVSSEPGVTLNSGAGASPDLRFATRQPTAMTGPEATPARDGWTIETTSLATSAPVTITALDYGAWGKVRAEVNIDGTWYDCLAPDGKNYVTVPFDADENHIADGWERANGVFGEPADADDEVVPVGASRGDGFSNYEEYRGFMVKKRWVSLNPKAKELFVDDQAFYGLGFAIETGILMYLVEPDEMRTDHVMNVNRRTASLGDQSGIRLVDARLADGTLGFAGHLGPPNLVPDIQIDTWQLLLSTTPGEIDSSIAHEIGHALALPHHGDWDMRSCLLGPSGLYAPWGGVLSGDRSCVMSYSAANYYGGWDGHCHLYTWPATEGTTFCDSKNGTGLNAGARRRQGGQTLPVSGAATEGNCLSLLRLK